jgi:aminopeptidase-like protein
MPEPEGSDGEVLYALVRELFPICRSLTGDGVRRTLSILSRELPLQVHEVPSGAPVLDWTVPREWNVREAWIADASGRRVVDFAASNLHLVSYSLPMRRRMPLSELRAHLHTLPEHPDWIPYRTSHYAEDWGFCLAQRQLDALPEGEYEVCIDTTLAPGHLTYGELLLPGETEEEILVSAHLCHPSLCDDNLSGIVVAHALGMRLRAAPRGRRGVRFLFAPGTIGAITWLACNREAARRVKHGLTLVCLGDRHPLTYKRTLEGSAAIDRAAQLVLRDRGQPHQVVDFSPYGYDERQYNSPGFRLPVGSLMRGRHGRFPEYHTSADDLGFVTPTSLAESLEVVSEIVEVLQADACYRNLQPWGEPQLGRRGLYRSKGGSELPGLEMAMLWVLSLADGSRSLVSIAERSGLPFRTLQKAAELLLAHELLGPVDPPPTGPPPAGRR